MTQQHHFIGLMSGTSLDGVDGVVLQRTDEGISVTHAHHLPMPVALRQDFLALNSSGPDELHRAALSTNRLMQCHAQVVYALLEASGLAASQIKAIGVHGQTVRHRPGAVGAKVKIHSPWNAYSVQLCNPALLAELCDTTVVADFRSRDVAAGGQGAPLVPAFHQAVFGRAGDFVAVVNVGGMANATLLGPQGEVSGFDTGPGNALLDMWCEAHTGHAFDANGAWASTGRASDALLTELLAEPYFAQQGARSTGRDLFNREWLDARLACVGALQPPDVQATLLALTAHTIAVSLPKGLTRCMVCGGGALNTALMAALQHHLPQTPVLSTDTAGMPAMQVEAAAFAWLASQTLAGLPGNVPLATGAQGPRVLGAVYPV